MLTANFFLSKVSIANIYNEVLIELRKLVMELSDGVMLIFQ